MNSNHMNQPTISGFCPGEPPTATAQHKGVSVRGGKPKFYTKTATKNADAILSRMILQLQPDQPLTGPVKLTCIVTFPWRKEDVSSQAKAIIAAERGSRPHTGYPDLDNWEKGFIDLLTKMKFIENDNQISVKNTQKLWGSNPGVFLEIQPLHDYWIEAKEAKDSK